MKNENQNKILGYPLSYAQRRIWFLNQLESDSLSYNIGSSSTVLRELDIEKVKQVFSFMIKYHEVFRTNFFTASNGEPVQMIRAEIKNDFEFYDISQESNKNKSRIEITKRRANQVFDLENVSLIRLTVIKIAEQKYNFLVVMHHIISDIWSLAIFVNDFFILYNKHEKKSGIKNISYQSSRTQYRDYAAWEQSLEFEKKIYSQEKYWLKQLAGELPNLNIPIDRPRPLVQTYDTKNDSFEINEELTRHINSLCQKYGVTPYVFLLTIFNIVLHKLSNQDDIIVGTFAANRDLPELDKVIGVFLNNLAIRTQIKSDQLFLNYLSQVNEIVLSAMENKEYPFEKLIEKLNPLRDMSRAPIFNIVFQMFNNDSRLKLNFFEDFGKKDFVFDNGLSQFDLTFKVFMGEKKISLVLTYNSTLFKKQTVKRFFSYYIELLKKISKQPECKISDLEIITESEKKKLLLEYNSTKIVIPDFTSVIDIFEKQKKLSLKKEAILFYEKTLSYEVFEQLVNQTARWLLKKGLKSGAVVGIMMQRSDDLIVTLFALLKIGAVYMPINETEPKTRVDFMLKDSRAKFVILDSEKVLLKSVNKILFSKKEIVIFDKTFFKTKTKITDLAYIIYTSGSTGKPKGVMISHGALVNFIVGIKKSLGLRPGLRILSLTNISFDIFFLESVASLCIGLPLVMVSESDQRDPVNLKKIIISKKVDVFQLTPSLLDVFLKYGNSYRWLFGIRKLLVGGEDLSDKLLARIKTCFKNEIYNLYGPSETTIWSSVANLSYGDNVNIGKPIANTQIYVLSPAKKLCPINVTGEIYISGLGLATTYTDKILTEKYFLPHPFIDGEKIYRTGDLGRITEQGNLEYRGRIGSQVKIYGKRVELGEIKSNLLQFPGVNQATVVLKVDDSGVKRLVAYYVASEEINYTRLKKFMEINLPTHMVPLQYIFLEKFPLNSNGKLDESGLPKPDFNILQVSIYQKPKNLIEKMVISIWEDVLKVKKIGRNDNFFQLGGQSLMLVNVYNQIENKFPGKISIAQLFSFSTPESLADYLSACTKEELTKSLDYRKKADDLIDQVRDGEISVSEAAKIFDRI